jgi:hypothetical protein
MAPPITARVKDFLTSTSSRPTLGFTEAPIQWVRGIKLLAISLVFSAEFKITSINISLLPSSWHSAKLTEHREFTSAFVLTLVLFYA